MQVEIYVDILFIINFFMIYFIFWVVNKLIKNKSKNKNLILGSFLASFFYLIAILSIPFIPFFNLFIIFFIILISIFVAFKPRNLYSFLKIFLLVNLVSFTFGGAFIAIFYYTNIGHILNFAINNFSLSLLIFCIIISYIFIKLTLNWYKAIFLKNQSFYEIILHKNGETITLNALLDTGNSLKEPITKKPVLIAEFLCIERLLTKPLAKIFKDKEENNLEKLLDIELENDIRFIPFKSLGKENGLLIGIKIDKLEIKSNKPILIENAIVGIYNFKISKNGFYNALLSPEMFNGE